jgi:hypothetical protein
MSTRQKSCPDMNFDEFQDWASKYAADAIMRGGFTELSSSMFVILAQAAQNKVWGGEKKKK